MSDVLLINGPNLNLLGRREPELYGHRTLEQIETDLKTIAASLDCTLHCFQSNAEHAIVERVQQTAIEGIEAILINPGAFTHTSIAIRDALLGVAIPFYEIHLSNIYARESFRHQSYFSDIAQGAVIGLGAQGYEFALRAAIAKLAANPS